MAPIAGARVSRGPKVTIMDVRYPSGRIPMSGMPEKSFIVLSFSLPGRDGGTFWPGLVVVAEREVALVFLGRVQPEDRVQPVQQRAQVSDVGVIGRFPADIVQELAEPPDLAADLGV